MGKTLNLKAAQELSEKDNSGEWFESKYGGRYFLRPLEQRAFIAKRDAEEKKIRARQNVKRGTDLTGLQQVECAVRAYVGTFLDRWDAVELEEGKPLELTPENFSKVCEAVPDLFVELSGFISSRDAEHTERLEAHSGN